MPTSLNPNKELLISVLNFPNILPHLASSFEQYLTLERVHPTKTYNYSAKGYSNLPVFEVTMHGPKCKTGESWLYVATPTGSSLASLDATERLYVGAQTQDRMFRGDGMGGNNYHHAEMRAGNADDNLLSFLQMGRKVDIKRISADTINSIVMAATELESLIILLQQPKNSKKHIGWWFEQYILFTEPKLWRWNTHPADKAIATILK